MRTTTRIVLPAAALGAVFALAAPLAASAHIHVSPGEAAAGSSTVVEFAVSHGCDGSPTRALTITVPEGVDAVQPVADPAWTIATTSEDAADGTERVGSVTFTAVEPLPSEYYGTVALSVRPSEDAVGQTLAFATLQECVDGRTDWSDDPADESANSAPAPAIVVSEPSADGGHGGAGGGGHDGAPADGHAGDAPELAQIAAPVDVVSRVFGIGGLALAAVAVVVALASRRRPARATEDAPAESGREGDAR